MRTILIASALISLASCNGADGFDQYASVKIAVRDVLKDPDSAQFKDLSPCGGDSNVIQGKVNAKNGFGGYTGFTDFIYADGRVGMPGDENYIALINICTEKVKAHTARLVNSMSPELRDEFQSSQSDK